MNLEKLRCARDYILNTTDWTQLADAPLTDVEKQEWTIYRQTLRDLPEQNITEDFLFPEPPELLDTIPMSLHTPKPTGNI